MSMAALINIPLECFTVFSCEFVYSLGLKEIKVSGADEAYKLLTIGKRNLQMACTKLNHNSSRRFSALLPWSVLNFSLKLLLFNFLCLT